MLQKMPGIFRQCAGSGLFVLYLLINTLSAALANDADIAAITLKNVIPDAKKIWIAENIIQNGMPMSILSFSVEASLGEVENFYKKRQAGAPVYIEHTRESSVVAYQEDDCFFSIRLKEEKNTFSQRTVTQGQIVATRLDTVPTIVADSKMDIPLLPNSKVISRMESDENNTHAVTLLLSNHYSKEANYRYVNKELEQEGWQKMSETGTSNSLASYKITYVLGLQSMQITLFPLQNSLAERTGILVHWLK